MKPWKYSRNSFQVSHHNNSSMCKRGIKPHSSANLANRQWKYSQNSFHGFPSNQLVFQPLLYKIRQHHNNNHTSQQQQSISTSNPSISIVTQPSHISMKVMLIYALTHIYKYITSNNNQQTIMPKESSCVYLPQSTQKSL